jgi:hypothetical protein
MTRISDIFDSARDILADKTAQRWDDPRLLRALNEGLLDIATETLMFREYIRIPLSLFVAEYDFPKDLILLKAAFSDNKELPVITSQVAAQQFGVNWRTHKTSTTITHVVFDQLENDKIRVYPIPQAFTASGATASDPYGIISDISLIGQDIELVMPDYGIPMEVSWSDPNAISLVDSGAQFGFAQITFVSEEATLTLYYCKHPTLAVDEDSELTINRAFDKALAHYVAGNCLRSDVDTQNRAYGDEELSFYNRQLAKLTKLSTMDHVATKHYNTTYNSMG